MKFGAFLFLCGLISSNIFSQVGIGTTNPDPSSLLDIAINPLHPRGFLGPRVSLDDITNESIDGMNINAAGLLIYNTNPTVTSGSGTGYYYWNGSLWVSMLSEQNSWLLRGNEVVAGEFLGTTNAEDLVFKVENQDVGRIKTNFSLHFGNLASSDGARSIAMGYTSNAAGEDSAAFGTGTIASGFRTVALGHNAGASDRNSIAIGENTIASGDSTISLGSDAQATATRSISIGDNAIASGTGSISFGDEAESLGTGGMAIGAFTEATQTGSIAFGENARAIAEDAVAIGSNTQATEQNTIILGNGDDNVGIGTATPKTTLDVEGQAGEVLRLDGITPPRLTGDQLGAKTYTAAQNGTIVFVTVAATNLTGQVINVDSEGLYLYMASTNSWICFGGC